MRARFIVQIFSLLVIVTVSATWMKSRATAFELQGRLSALTAFRHNTTRALERERDRLRAALAEANRRREADPAAPSFSPVQPVAPAAAVPSLALGEWRSAKEWRNEGQSTAQGTVTTLLWAAAGGDVAAMTSLIAYDDAARTEAQALFDALPPTARQAFPTPEALVAGLTIQAVPTNGVQLSWFHQRDADHATVGLLLGLPDPNAPAEVRVVPAQDSSPPMLAGPAVDPYANQFAVLSLRRSSSGWRVVIPAAAVKRLARQYKTAAN
jgi:hypothetical protein